MPTQKRKAEETKKSLAESAKKCKSVAAFFVKPTNENAASTSKSPSTTIEEVASSSKSLVQDAEQDTTVHDISQFEAEQELIDEEYWNIPNENIDSDEDGEGEFLIQKKIAEKSDKRYYGSSKYEEDYQWLYFSQHHQGWMCKICEKYPYNGGQSHGAFSTRACQNTKHPNHSFQQHQNSSRHKRLEEKLYDSTDTNNIKEAFLNAEKQNVSRTEVNNLYLRKCIQTIYFMVNTNIALSDNYGRMIQFLAQQIEEPITRQYLDTCPQNATYISNTSAETLLDAMNFYFEKQNLHDIAEAPFLCLYADEAENSSHKECFSMFVTYFSVNERKVKTSFLGIVNLKGKKAAEVMDVIKQFFEVKNIKVENIFFSVLDGTNAMSGKKSGLQRRIRHYSTFNIFINCRNHRLALCLPHIMKDPDFSELLMDYDAVLLGLWKTFHYSPKKGALLESVQMIYGKKPLKILKAAVTRWLTHGRASQRILDCFKELLETVDQICLDTNESEVRGYRTMLIQHKIIFCICLLTDILSIMNILSLVLQKEGILFVDIKHSVNVTLQQLRKLAEADKPEEFSNLLSPKKSYYANYQFYLDILSDFNSTRRHLRSRGSEINIENFHYSIGTPFIEKLILEIEEALDITDFPVLDAFHAYHPRNITSDIATYGLDEAKLIYDHYGTNKIDCFENQRNESAAILKCGEDSFVVQSKNYN